MNACFCRRCGRVFIQGADVCPVCRSLRDMATLRAGCALPVGYHDGDWYRDPDNGRRWVAVTVSDGVRLMDPQAAASWILGTGERVMSPYDPMVYDDLLVCREDWRTSDGVRWTVQWKFHVSACPRRGVCEVVR